MNILISWTIAFFVLFFYYNYLQLPMEWHFMRGLDYANNNMDDQAIIEFNKVIHVYPNYTPAYYNLSYIYHKERDSHKCYVYYGYAVKNSIRSSEDLIERGLYHLIGQNPYESLPGYNNYVLNDYPLTLLHFYGNQK